MKVSNAFYCYIQLQLKGNAVNLKVFRAPIKQNIHYTRWRVRRPEYKTFSSLLHFYKSRNQTYDD